MAKALIALLGIIVVALSAFIYLLLSDPEVSTVEIDRDRSAISEQIAAATADASQYQGGALKVLIDVRTEILRNTLAMLDQKRASAIRKISLGYIVDATSAQQATEQELTNIIEDIQQAERRVAEGKAEALKYSGGLIQAMALVRSATDEVTVSQLRATFYAAKYGMAPPLPQSDKAGKAVTSPGAVVKDRDAL